VAADVRELHEFGVVQRGNNAGGAPSTVSARSKLHLKLAEAVLGAPASWIVSDFKSGKRESALEVHAQPMLTFQHEYVR
jgi:hypothetical protein